MMMMIIFNGRASGEDGVSRLMLREHIFRRDEYFCVDDDEKDEREKSTKIDRAIWIEHYSH